jgi:glucokinase
MNCDISIVGDIGGTYARFARVGSVLNQLEGIRVLPCVDFPNLGNALQAYLQAEHIEGADQICLAVAGPVESDLIDMPNNHWKFSISELQATFSSSLKIINDFTAQALCIPLLQYHELVWVGTPRPSGGHRQCRQVKTVIGPGTGLGVAAVMPSGEVVPSEGGHVAFAPVNQHEIDILKTMWARFDRVSVERFLSGSGLSNLYWANAKLQGKEADMQPPEVVAGAMSGEPICRQAVEDFCAILGSVAGDMALAMGSLGGIYLSGGILPRIKNYFLGTNFRDRFEDKGRFSEFCRQIPIAMVLAEYPGLLGCAAALEVE